MTSNNIVFVTALPAIFEDAIAAAPGEFHVSTISNQASEEEKIAQLKDTEIILGVFPALSEPVLRSAKKLKFIQLLHAGYEMMNLPLLEELGIACATSGNVNSPAVAELTIGLMLAVSRKILSANARLKAGGWTMDSPETDPYTHAELYDKTVGFVGLGNIGLHVAKRLRAFECRLCYYKPHRLELTMEEQLGLEYVALDALYRKSDFISIHASLNADTRSMVDQQALQKMKPTAILINTARGAIIDESALVDALQRQDIAGAGLDVLHPEPPTQENPLLNMPNVVTTPHIGGGTRGTQDRMFEFCWQNIRTLLAGSMPRYIITKS